MRSNPAPRRDRLFFKQLPRQRSETGEIVKRVFHLEAGAETAAAGPAVPHLAQEQGVSAVDAHGSAWRNGLFEREPQAGAGGVHHTGGDGRRLVPVQERKTGRLIDIEASSGAPFHICPYRTKSRYSERLG